MIPKQTVFYFFPLNHTAFGKILLLASKEKRITLFPSPRRNARPAFRSVRRVFISLFCDREELENNFRLDTASQKALATTEPEVVSSERKLIRRPGPHLHPGEEPSQLASGPSSFCPSSLFQIILFEFIQLSETSVTAPNCPVRIWRRAIGRMTPQFLPARTRIPSPGALPVGLPHPPRPEAQARKSWWPGTLLPLAQGSSQASFLAFSEREAEAPI